MFALVQRFFAVACIWLIWSVVILELVIGKRKKQKRKLSVSSWVKKCLWYDHIAKNKIEKSKNVKLSFCKKNIKLHGLLKNTARFLTLSRPKLTGRLLFQCIENCSEQARIKRNTRWSILFIFHCIRKLLPKDNKLQKYLLILTSFPY